MEAESTAQALPGSSGFDRGANGLPYLVDWSPDTPIATIHAHTALIAAQPGLARSVNGPPPKRASLETLQSTAEVVEFSMGMAGFEPATSRV
jgi:hypothetical protein